MPSFQSIYAKFMKHVRPVLSGAVILAVVVIGVWQNVELRRIEKAKSPITDTERVELALAVASAANRTSTNIASVERLAHNSVKVYTLSETGRGGEWFEFRANKGKWVQTDRGVWLE